MPVITNYNELRLQYSSRKANNVSIKFNQLNNVAERQTDLTAFYLAFVEWRGKHYSEYLCILPVQNWV